MNRIALLLGIVGFLAGMVVGHLLTRTRWDSGQEAGLESLSPPETHTMAFAKNLVMPLVPFDEGVSIEDAVDYLRAQTRMGGVEFDGQPKPYRLNFVIVDPNHTAKEFRMSLSDIRLDHLCERIAQASGLTVSFDEDAITFREIPKANTSAMDKPDPASS